MTGFLVSTATVTTRSITTGMQSITTSRKTSAFERRTPLTMCGIAGVVSFAAPISPQDLDAVQRMTDAQSHRGPDGSGSYHDSRIAFGHRRLSIIDVSAAGRQPMTNETGSVWVTYNGE